MRYYPHLLKERDIGNSITIQVEFHEFIFLIKLSFPKVYNASKKKDLKGLFLQEC